MILTPLTSFSNEHVGLTEQLFSYYKMELNTFFYLRHVHTGLFRTAHILQKAFLLEKHTSCKLITKLLYYRNCSVRKHSRKKRKNSHNKASYNYLGSQFKQILIKKDHNIHPYSLFCIVVLAEENLRKPLLLVTYRNQVFLYFHFKLANKKVPKNKNSAHFPLI